METLVHRLLAPLPIVVAIVAVMVSDSPWFRTSRADAVVMPASQEEHETSVKVEPTNRLPNFGHTIKDNFLAVVNIHVSGGSNTARSTLRSFDDSQSSLGDDPALRSRIPKMQTPVYGLGSGFVVRDDGLIITNAHVVDGASNISVKLSDRREFNANLLGMDKPTDIALLKIGAENLQTVRLGNPAQSVVGDWVIAIGSPFGLENSVTAGIISAKARILPEQGYTPFLQTDVALNPGNSGGPLFNINGEVIGINSQIYSRNGGYQGVSFAIPIDIALAVERELLRDGKVNRGWLGVTIQDVNQGLANAFGLDKPRGALVDSVEPESPAAKAGVVPGDIILKINDQEIMELNDFSAAMMGLTPGAKARVTVFREGISSETHLDIDEFRMDAASVGGIPELGHNALGLAVRRLTDDECQKLNVVSGLLVEQSIGPAAEANIMPGDIILALNGHPLSEPEQLRTLVIGDPKNVALLVMKEGSPMYVSIGLE